MQNGENSKTVRWYVGQMWRDLLSVYYANTPVWRWLKSGALVFFGFFLWMGGSVLLSVQPGWTFLHYVMAYGFLVIVWGPLTHFVVVPLAIRLRRTAEHPIARAFARNSGKVNLAIFFTLVAIFGTITPGIMLLEFSPAGGGDGSPDVSGEVVCDVDDVITCRVENPSGIDHVVATSGGEVIARAEEPPFEVEIDRNDIVETRTGGEFRIEFRDENGETVRRFVRTVPDDSSGS
jgi:hypothetical protein